MPKLMRKQAAHDFVSLHPRTVLRHYPMPGVDQHSQVVGTGDITVFGFP